MLVISEPGADQSTNSPTTLGTLPDGRRVSSISLNQMMALQRMSSKRKRSTDVSFIDGDKILEMRKTQNLNVY